MPRPRYIGLLLVILSLILVSIFVYGINSGIQNTASLVSMSLFQLTDYAYFAISIPIAIVSLFVILTGFWIGWTILTIKVVPPMPDIVDKRDYSKIKAAILCLATMVIAFLFIYGIYIRSYWALAIPAAIITLVLLGAIFWVGLAILTTRTSLPRK